MRTTLTIYYRHAAQQPYINLQIDQAVSSAEHDDEVQAQINSDANRDIGHRKVRPKKAHRAADNVTIYFTVSIHFAQITICYFIGLLSG